MIPNQMNLTLESRIKTKDKLTSLLEDFLNQIALSSTKMNIRIKLNR